MCKKELYVISAAIVTLVFVVMFFPVMGNAQNLPPVPTPPILKNIPPAWSQTLQCDATACPRFELVMDGAAVLDHETGLVWQRYVNEGTTVTFSWYDAFYICANLDLGGRKGWHLPSIEQLASLVDKSVDGWKLPAGSPFVLVQTGLGGFWSATSYAVDSTSALIMGFGRGDVAIQNKNFLRPVWCVRGGQSNDGY
jgi:hypothetical protein